MPNGRQLARLIPRDNFTRAFQSIEGDPVVGSINGTDVVLSTVERLAEGDPAELLFVEGQWRGPGVTEHFIVIHFDRKQWLWVPEASPAWKALFKVWMETPLTEAEAPAGSPFSTILIRVIAVVVLLGVLIWRLAR